MNKSKNKRLLKKQKHKEEIAQIEAAQAKVVKANSQENPLSLLPAFQKFDRNGLNLNIECKRVRHVNKEDLDWAFQLTKANVAEMYKNCDWGWSDKNKFEEMNEESAWYLIARDNNNKPVGFIHFRFDLDFNVEVIYCYEIHIIPELRRKGIGKFLLQILELLSYKNQMKKVLLTVFKENTVACTFFKNVMKYKVDETSPEEDPYDEPNFYEILSKATVSKK